MYQSSYRHKIHKISEMSTEKLKKVKIKWIIFYKVDNYVFIGILLRLTLLLIKKIIYYGKFFRKHSG